MAQDRDMTPPPELNAIAIRYPEKTFYLGQVFNNTTNCYKLVWLLALLSLLERDAAMSLRLTAIFNEMAVIGWHPVCLYRLSLGRQDSLQNVVLEIREACGLAPNARPEAIRRVIEGNLAAQANLNFLKNYVPTRFLTPWFTTQLQGMPDTRKDAAIKKLASDSQGTTFASMYYFDTIGAVDVIRFNKLWHTFLLENLAVVRTFAEHNFALYLQARNPNTPGVVRKLRAPTTRQLTAARDLGATALPIFTVLLCDEAGDLGQALAELAVLEESVSEEDRVRFGNLIPAHTEKLRRVVHSQVDAMIKQRLYVTSLRDDLESQRLSRAGTELFGHIYKSPVTFFFDGFSTARGNAADSCLELTTELLLGKLDYDAVMGKPVKVQNRAITVLQDSWGIFGKNDGRVLTRPSHPVLRELTTRWDDLLASGERRLPVEQMLRKLCSPPYGANIASAALMLGVFLAPRIEKLVVARDGQQFVVSQWIQDRVFRGKFIDLNGLRGIDLVMLGEESSEWEVLLDEWEQAESYLVRVACHNRASALKRRIPVPPALAYREIHLEELARTAHAALAKMEEKQEDAFRKLESGSNRGDAGLIAWGATALRELCLQMTKEKPLWDEHQVAELQPHIERARQEIIHLFPAWLNRQTPRSDAPDAIGDFKHQLVRLIGGNLKKLELNDLFELLEKHVGQIVRNAETAAEARQLIRDVRSWQMSHGNAHRVVRVAEGDALLNTGKGYASKLQGMSQRITLPELGEVRTQLSEFLTQLKDAIEQIRNRAMRLWDMELHSEDDLETCLEDVDTLVTAFENCTNDLTDLHLMRRALRTYHEDYKQLANARLTWPEFEALAETLQKDTQAIIDDDDVPWPPSKVLSAFATVISKQRKEASAAWIDAIEADAAEVACMSAADANRLHVRASAPPAVLTDPDTERLGKILTAIETRLDALKIDWLVERYKELSSPLQKQFLQAIEYV
jgi:hypothetical protein